MLEILFFHYMSCQAKQLMLKSMKYKCYSNIHDFMVLLIQSNLNCMAMNNTL